MPRTTRVRILVAVDDKGQWMSHGYQTNNFPQSDDDIREWIRVGVLTKNYCCHWIEADVPVPEPAMTIVGDVKGE